MKKYKMSREVRRKNREHQRKWRAEQSRNKEIIKKIESKGMKQILKKLGIKV